MRKARAVLVVFVVSTIVGLVTPISGAAPDMPTTDVLMSFYPANCPRGETAWGWYHDACWGRQSQGNTYGHWCEVERNDCELGNPSMKYYEFCNGVWNEVSLQVFDSGECTCATAEESTTQMPPG